MVGIITEILVKIINGQNHVIDMAFSLYLGATPEDLNSHPWIMYSMPFSVLPYALSLITYMVLKSR